MTSKKGRGNSDDDVYPAWAARDNCLSLGALMERSFPNEED